MIAIRAHEDAEANQLIPEFSHIGELLPGKAEDRWKIAGPEKRRSFPSEPWQVA